MAGQYKTTTRLKETIMNNAKEIKQGNSLIKQNPQDLKVEKAIIKIFATIMASMTISLITIFYLTEINQALNINQPINIPKAIIFTVMTLSMLYQDYQLTKNEELPIELRNNIQDSVRHIVALSTEQIMIIGAIIAIGIVNLYIISY